ncbi:MAG: hypothetical protein KGO96_07210 [Elusimicrobia bacterium]|nr:hypothetical protein [Elusimicrobiota bacterium]
MPTSKEYDTILKEIRKTLQELGKEAEEAINPEDDLDNPALDQFASRVYSTVEELVEFLDSLL